MFNVCIGIIVIIVSPASAFKGPDSGMHLPLPFPQASK